MGDLLLQVGGPPGVPVGTPTHDVGVAQNVLANMNASYPGEAFSLNESPAGDLTVMWVPNWSLVSWINQTISARLLNIGIEPWPGSI